MENQNQPPAFNPFQTPSSIEPQTDVQMESQPLQPPDGLSQKRRFNKKIGVIIGLAIVTVGLVSGLVALGLQADAAAKQYAKDVDAHLTEVLGETDMAVRLGKIDNEATLNYVFMGQILNSKYATASTSLKDEYQTVLTDGAEYTKLKSEQAEYVINKITSDLLQETAEDKTSIDTSKDVDTKAMEATLIAMLNKAEKLDQIADTAEQAVSISTYSSRDAFIKSVRDWAAAQRGVVQAYLDWTGDVTDMSSQALKDIASGSNAVVHFDESTYQARIDQHIANYAVFANQAVDSLTDMANELEGEPTDTRLSEMQDKLNEDTTTLRAEVEKIIN